jgi:hypothetical protein
MPYGAWATARASIWSRTALDLRSLSLIVAMRRLGRGADRRLVPYSSNMRSLLLWPISFCIFGMCSPWRKSVATVWTVMGVLATQFGVSPPVRV